MGQPNECYGADEHRRERRSSKSKVDQEFTAAKSELIRLRIAEKSKTLMPTETALADMELVIGGKPRVRLA